MSIYKFSGRSERILTILKILISVSWRERGLSAVKRDKDLSVGKREICLLARERSVCWQDKDLSVGKREIVLLARKRIICWQERERDLSFGKTERERARPGRVPANCEHSQK